MAPALSCGLHRTLWRSSRYRLARTARNLDTLPARSLTPASRVVRMTSTAIFGSTSATTPLIFTILMRRPSRAEVPSKPVWRNAWFSDYQEQAVLLWRCGGEPHYFRRDAFRTDRSYCTDEEGELQRVTESGAEFRREGNHALRAKHDKRRYNTDVLQWSTERIVLQPD